LTNKNVAQNILLNVFFHSGLIQSGVLLQIWAVFKVLTRNDIKNKNK
jgi:hypothetical protein